MNFSIEPIPTAFLLAAFGALMAVSVLLKRWADRLGVPVVLIFLLLGMVAGSESIGGIHFEDYGLAFRLGTVALILILFDGGLNTSLATVRKAVAPAAVLATLGVVLTAGLTAVAARLFGMPWPIALLLGAVVSSTDAATVFAVLRGSQLTLKPRLNATLELESGLNDPMAVILTIALTQAFAGGPFSGWTLVWGVPLQLAVGLAAGLGFGYGARWVLNRVHLSTIGLYPILTLAVAFAAFGCATLLQGSGFLAVYIAAMVLGNGPLPSRSGLARVHDALAWLSQIGMFLMLGLLVFPSALLPVAGLGLAIAFFLALVARPLAVALCLLPFRMPSREVLYVGWVGLRGAVPIVLATFPVLYKVSGADEVFNLVFFIVVVNALIPGSTVRWLTRRWDLMAEERPSPPAVLEINSTRQLEGELASYFIDPSLAVCGVRLAQIKFPPGASAVLVVRDGALVACRGETELLPGDHVYVFMHHEDRPYIQLLFGRPQDDS